MATAIVQAVLNRRRRRDEADGDEDAPVGDGNERGHHQQNGNVTVNVPPEASHKKVPEAVQAEEIRQHGGGPATLGHVDHRTVILHKDRLTERLVLEEAMMWRLPRCLLFLLQFFLFMAMLWVSYPATSVLPVRQALSAGLEVDGTMPEDIHTLEDLKSYLAGLAENWRIFSPGSLTYAEDPMARNYLGSIAECPPVVSYPSVLAPTLGDAFTITAWIQTDVRFDTIMKLTQEGRDDAICWQFDLERVIYGAHETDGWVEVVHPWAEPIYDSDENQDEAWKKSAFRGYVSDSKWHHMAVLVEASQVGFGFDGEIVGYKSLERPITGCSGSTFTVGSTNKTGNLVDIKYIPRLLTQVELSFLRTKGKLLDDMLAGGGPAISQESDHEQLVRLAAETDTHVSTEVAAVTSFLTSTFRSLAGVVRDFVETSETAVIAKVDDVGSMVAGLTDEHDSVIDSIVAAVDTWGEKVSSQQTTALNKLNLIDGWVEWNYQYVEANYYSLDAIQSTLAGSSVTGAWMLQVANVPTFLSVGVTAVGKSISDLLGAPAEWIIVTLTDVTARRLQQLQQQQQQNQQVGQPTNDGRRLQTAGAVAAAYSIVIPFGNGYAALTDETVADTLSFQVGDSTASSLEASIQDNSGIAVGILEVTQPNATNASSSNITDASSSDSSSESIGGDSSSSDSTTGEQQDNVSSSSSDVDSNEYESSTSGGSNSESYAIDDNSTADEEEEEEEEVDPEGGDYYSEEEEEESNGSNESSVDGHLRRLTAMKKANHGGEKRNTQQNKLEVSPPQDSNVARFLSDSTTCQDDDSCWSYRLSLVKTFLDDLPSTFVNGHAAGNLLKCMLDNDLYSHLTEAIVLEDESVTVGNMEPGDRHPFLPPHSTLCDEVSGCVDDPEWTDSYGQTCFDYSVHREVDGEWMALCEDGKWGGLASISGASVDSSAAENCCACGRDNLVDTCESQFWVSVDWAVYQDYFCYYYDEDAWGPDALDCDRDSATSNDGVTNKQACCECGRLSTYKVNLTDLAKTDIEPDGEEWSDVWGHTCTHYKMWHACTHSGINPDTIYYYGSSTKPPGDISNDWYNSMYDIYQIYYPGSGGLTAWDACAYCGGGEYTSSWQWSEVTQGAKVALQYLLGSVDVHLCNDDQAKDFMYSYCPATCAYCSMEDAPTISDVQRALLQCNDLVYADWLGEDCSWYMQNDAADEDQGTCSRYADDEVKASCLKTCETCPHTSNMIDVFDMSGDGLLQLEEYNAMGVAAGYALETPYSWRRFVRNMCDEIEDYSRHCLRTHYPAPGKELLNTDGSSTKILFNTLAARMLSEMQEPASYLPSSYLGRVLDLSSALVFETDDNLALQTEPISTVFGSCTTDDDCQESASACGYLSDGNPICSRSYILPTYCASECRTGGCGDGGGVLPFTTGSYCQPCDGCVLEIGRDCPSYCEDYIWDKDTNTFPAQTNATILPVAYRTALDNKEMDLDGSFSLSAWVRSFGTQWLFEKSVKIPGLTGDWAGYNETTGMLTCWRMSQDQVQFRNTWDEEELTSVKNPLASKITTAADEWHFVALLKSSYMATSNQRRDQLTWMVDGEVSEQPTDALGEVVWDIPEYGFPDCGGQILSLTSVTEESYAGPTDFFTTENDSFPEWSDMWNPQSSGTIQSRSLPLADSDSGMTVLSFRDVELPKNAQVKSANVLICAAQTWIDYLAHLQDSSCIPSSWASQASNLKIAGIKTANTMALHDTSYSTCAVASATNSSMKTAAEVSWRISYNSWRTTGIVQGPNETVYSSPDSCYVASPDIKDIVSEQLAYLDLDENDGIRRDLNFVFANADHSWVDCGAESIFESDTEKNQYLDAVEKASESDQCNDHITRNQFMMDKLPLWMVPAADYEAGRSGAARAMLQIQYCLNEDCLSPSFLGAGPSASNTGFGTVGEYAAASDDTSSSTEGEEEDSNSSEEDSNSSRRLARPAPQKTKTHRRNSRAQRPKKSSKLPGLPAASISTSDSEFVQGARASIGLDSEVIALRERYEKVRNHERRGPKSKIPIFAKGERSEAAALAIARSKLARKLSNKKQSSPLPRKLSEDSSSCASSSCVVVGGLLQTGLSATGKLYSPRFLYRAVATSELQKDYYNTLPSIAPDGQEQITGGEVPASKTEASVAQYPKEVVSIIPPVVFQRRSLVTECSTLVPAIADSLEAYFKNQVSGRCSSTYTCDRESGFTCIDRSKNVPSTETHFETKTIAMSDGNWYAEFLDMFSVPVIYRGDIVNTEDWIDLQTSEVSIVNVFLAPSLQLGTTLRITFSYDGPGRLAGSTTFRSFTQMSDSDRDIWIALNWVIFGLAALDIILVCLEVLGHVRFRRRTLAELGNMSMLQKDTIIRNTPSWSMLAVFDILFRGVNIGFCWWHWTMYPAPKSVDNGVYISPYEEVVKDILDLNWGDVQVTTEEKVDNFMNLVLRLNEHLESEDFHRMMGTFLVLLFFVRVVIYMRVHPKIAVLYATIVEMAMDFVHFCVVFFFLYAVLAFLGMWSFGDKTSNFRDFGTALYTQFRMLAGEFNMDDGQESGFEVVWGLWCVTYFLMVFSLLLNFFLAIVVDSYASVKEAVQTCQVEKDVIWDIVAASIYPLVAILNGWPGRGRLVTLLLRADLDQDNINDEDGDKDIPVSAEMLDLFQIVKGKHSSEHFVKYYRWVCPALDFGYKEPGAELEHKTILRAAVEIDSIRHDILGEKRIVMNLPQKDPSLQAIATEVKRDFVQVRHMLAQAEALRQQDMDDLVEVLGLASPSSRASRISLRTSSPAPAAKSGSMSRAASTARLNQRMSFPESDSETEAASGSPSSGKVLSRMSSPIRQAGNFALRDSETSIETPPQDVQDQLAKVLKLLEENRRQAQVAKEKEEHILGIVHDLMGQIQHSNTNNSKKAGLGAIAAAPQSEAQALLAVADRTSDEMTRVKC